MSRSDPPMPHERLLLEHRAKLEAVYRRVERNSPREGLVGRWLKRCSVGRVLFALSLVSMAVTVSTLAPLLYRADRGWGVAFAFAWAAALVPSGLLALWFGERCHRWVARWSRLEATGAQVQRLTGRLQAAPDERLMGIWQGWMNARGASYITAHEVVVLEEAFEQLTALRAEQAERVAGLDHVEIAFGMVSRARALQRRSGLEHALPDPGRSSSPSVRPRL